MASLQTYQYVRTKLFEKLHSLGMRYFDQTPAGSIVSRVSNDTETLYEFWYVFLMVLTGILQSYLLCRHVSDQRKNCFIESDFLTYLDDRHLVLSKIQLPNLSSNARKIKSIEYEIERVDLGNADYPAVPTRSTSEPRI